MRTRPLADAARGEAPPTRDAHATLTGHLVRSAHVRPRCHHGDMTYDEELAQRIRVRIGAERGLAETHMFGGLAFLIEGSMALAVSGRGGLIARVDAEDGIALSERDGVAPMIMNRRPMRGWLRVAPDVVADDDALDEWVTRCVDYVKGTINAAGDGTV